ncbi:ATP-dependent DNA helicase PIF1-like protein [Tanacetum coccineum]
MHCTARGNIAHNFLWLKEGSIYSVKNFTVQANKDDFRMLRFAHFMLELDGDTVVRKSSVRSDGFDRYPFQFVEFDSFKPTNNKYLIDAAGYVKNVGKTTQQKNDSKTIDFHLANSRGKSLRVTLWGHLSDMLIKKQTRHVGLYPIFLTAMSVKLYNSKTFRLSNSSAIHDNHYGVELTKEMLSLDNTEAKAGTLENLLMLARNQKYDYSTFHYVVRIDKVRTNKGWNYSSCGGEKCKKGNFDRKDGQFWCDSCNSSVDYPVIRYRLELEISDATAEAVVVMFDETTKSLVKCSASSIVGSEDQEEGDLGLLPALANIVGTSHTLELKAYTYFEHENYESFTYWKVIKEEDVVETGSFGTVAATAYPKAPVLKSLAATLSTTLKILMQKSPLLQTVRQREGTWAVLLTHGKGKGNNHAVRFTHSKHRPSYCLYQPIHVRYLMLMTKTEVSYHIIGAPSYECRSCNAIVWYEERNNKGNRDPNPTFSLCWQQGKVLLARFNETPAPLNRPLDYSQPTTSNFKDQIMVYNDMFYFTSFGARIDHSINVGMGLYTFRINGQNYHRIGYLLPKEGTQPRYAQLWLFDTHNEIRNRLVPLLRHFRMARDWCHSHTSVNVELRLLSERTSARQYNLPTVVEVDALITNDFGDGEPTRDIVVNKKDSEPKRISELHPSYMALQYPLLFPYGEDGYHDNIPYHTNTGKRKTTRDNVIIKEYYAYIIQYRKDQGTTLLRG